MYSYLMYLINKFSDYNNLYSLVSNDLCLIDYEYALKLAIKRLKFFNDYVNNQKQIFSSDILSDFSKYLENISFQEKYCYNIISKNKLLFKPKISVIVPVYNTEKFIITCLSSVLKSSLHDIEVICIDDGSTDKSLEILKEFRKSDDRIFLLSQNNLYAGTARNLGLKFANGDYIHFLDSDDFIDSDAYKSMYNIIVEQDSPFIKFRSHTYDNETNQVIYSAYTDIASIKNLNRFMTLKDDIAEIIKVPDSPWSGLYNSSFLRKHKILFDKKKCANDVLFFFNCLKYAKKFYLSSNYYIYYRINRKNSLIDIRHKNFVDIISNFYELEKMFEDYNYNLKKIILRHAFRSIHRSYVNSMSLPNDKYKISTNFLYNDFINNINNDFIPPDIKK